MYKIVNVNDDWQKLVDPNGEVIAENHVLYAEDVLYALNLAYERVFERDEDCEEDYI